MEESDARPGPSESQLQQQINALLHLEHGLR